MLTINLVFILRESVNYSVNLFSNRNMNSASVADISLASTASSVITMHISHRNASLTKHTYGRENVKWVIFSTVFYNNSTAVGSSEDITTTSHEVNIVL